MTCHGEKPNRSTTFGRLDGWLRDLHIKDTSAKDDGQAFAGINYGTINYAAPKQPEESSAEKIGRWQEQLSMTDPRDDRGALISTKGRRVENTCEWITDDANYKAWLHGESPLLWLSGGPGKGKTMLSIFLTQQLERRLDDGSHLIYYFCSHQDERRNNAAHIVQSLLWQITRITALRDRVLHHCAAEEIKIQTLLSSRESLWRLFAAIVQDPLISNMYCVIDGLDECDDESTLWLIRKLSDLISAEIDNSENHALRIVIASRELPSLPAVVASIGCSRIKLDPDHDDQINGDIEKLVAASIEKFSHLEGHGTEFKEVSQILLERAEGTFLWVGFAVNELEQETTCSGVLQKLRSFPKGLDPIYRRMLLSIDDPQRRLQASMILRWVAITLSPPTLNELAEAMQIQNLGFIAGGSTDNLVAVLGEGQVIRDQVKMCGSILQIHGNTVALVHKSAREFLLRQGADDSTILQHFRIQPGAGHMLVALTCLACIKRSPLRYKALFPDKDDDQVLWQESPLLHYAVVHWPEHVRLSSDHGKSISSSSSFLFETDADVRQHWFQTYAACVVGDGKECGISIAFIYDEPGSLADTLRGVETKVRRELNENALPPLHMACRFGLIEWTRSMLTARKEDRGLLKWVNALDAHGLDALTWAAIEGHANVAELLLDHGANVHSTTALLRRGQYSVFRSKTLTSHLRQWTDEDAVWSGKHSLLYRAAFRGHLAVVKLLLERGADPNAKGYANLSALHAAVIGDHEDVLRLLLEKGGWRSVNATSSMGLVPLYFAMWTNNYNVAKLLLESGANVGMKQALFKLTVLHYAIFKNTSVRMIELLLDKGADLSSKTFASQTPLHLAAASYRDDIVRLLVHRGAVVDTPEFFGGNTSVHNAARHCSGRDSVEALLNGGADIDATNSKGKTALHLAARDSRNRETVVLLLSHGADANVRSKKGKTALLVATKRSGNNETIAALLRHGADVNAKCNKGMTPLYQAARWSRGDMLSTLISHGADINAKNNEGNSLMHVAARLSSKDLIPLLLELGANVNEMNGDGDTVLDLIDSGWSGERSHGVKTLLISAGAVSGQQIKARQAKPAKEARFSLMRAFDRRSASLACSSVDTEAKRTQPLDGAMSRKESKQPA